MYIYMYIYIYIYIYIRDIEKISRGNFSVQLKIKWNFQD